MLCTTKVMVSEDLVVSLCAPSGGPICALCRWPLSCCVCPIFFGHSFWRLCCLCWCVFASFAGVGDQKSYRNRAVGCRAFKSYCLGARAWQKTAYFLHIPAKSRRFSDVPVFSLRKFARNCLFFGWFWLGFALVGGVFLVAYLHDGWWRGLYQNNQEKQK